MDISKLQELARDYKAVCPELRYGQSLMNALWELHPELYKQITATEHDCFYIDSVIPKFLTYLLDHE